MAKFAPGRIECCVGAADPGGPVDHADCAGIAGCFRFGIDRLIGRSVRYKDEQ